MCTALYCTKFTSKYEIKVEKKYRMVVNLNGEGKVHQEDLCVGGKIRKYK